MASVKDTVLDLVRSQVLPGRQIDDRTSLYSLGANSLTMVSVKSSLEALYKIRIPDEVATAEAFRSVESIVQLLDKLGVR
ncbi:MAG: hypothetical protein JXA09_16565 [Anaerolineae bacterium]|nr:hypothetical protein [Anaerolineae bacterium]